MTSSGLKGLAIFTMLVDHVGCVLFPEAGWLRGIGRLSFPIFCFLISEGCYYTGNLPRYLGRLALFALLSEIPYDLALRGTWLFPNSQNVFFTLFLGLSAGGLYSRLGRERPFFCMLGAGLLAALSVFLRTDYSWYGVLLIFWFVLCRNVQEWNGLQNKAAAIIGFFILNLGFSCLTGAYIQLLAGLAAAPIGLYTGKKGKALPKYVLYGFYPAHLLCLWFLAGKIGSSVAF